MGQEMGTMARRLWHHVPVSDTLISSFADAFT